MENKLVIFEMITYVQKCVSLQNGKKIIKSIFETDFKTVSKISDI